MKFGQTIIKMVTVTSIICPLIIASACTGKNKLTRDKAAQMIADNLPNKLEVGEIHYYPRTILTPEYYSIDWGERNPWDVLKSKGLINYKESPGGVLGLLRVIDVQITEEGRKYLIGYEGKSLKIKLAEKKFLGVTGIKFDASEKTAIVPYQWRYELTPFGTVGKYPSEEIHIEHATFGLYDDGWRLERIQ